jgi:hypothetical protein
VTLPSVRDIIVPPSVILSALEHKAGGDDLQRRLARTIVDPAVMQSPRDAIVSALQSYVAEHAADNGAIDPHRRAIGARTVKFDSHDVAGYVGSFFSWWGGIVKHKWIEPPATAEPIADGATLALFADWGTGLYGAPFVAEAITTLLPDAAIHLGDVYYSGTPREQLDRCVTMFPGAVRQLALPGNHDMYSGGDGYFDVVLPFCKQAASCFALANEHWLVLGLDTAYIDGDMTRDQIDWMDGLIAAHPDHDVLVLSHHQPWSAFESPDDEHSDSIQLLPRRTRLDTRRINTWYWGHEHRCAIYNQHPVFGTYGRCIGHGGFPYGRGPGGRVLVGKDWWAFDPNAYAPVGGMVLDAPNSWLGDDYGQHGFATVTLLEHAIDERIYDANGTLLWSQQRGTKL